MAFSLGDIYNMVYDFVGEEDVDSLLATWIDMATNQVAMRIKGISQKSQQIISMQASQDALYELGVNVFQVESIYMMTSDSKLDDFYPNPLVGTTIRNIWEAEHKRSLETEERPRYWAPAGINIDDVGSQDGTDGTLLFRVFPQPTSGTFSAAKLWVNTLVIPAGALPVGFDEAVMESVLKFAYLYTEDRPGYLLARSGLNKSLRRLMSARRGGVLQGPTFGGTGGE